MDRLFLSRFFAVTATAVFEVTYGVQKAVVRKIAAQSNDDNWPRVGSYLNGGNLVTITPTGLWMIACRYNDDKKTKTDSEPEICCNTSAVVALFLNKNDALRVLETPGRKPLDRRWRTETLITLAEIGIDHPVFILFDREPSWFIYPDPPSFPRRK